MMVASSKRSKEIMVAGTAKLHELGKECEDNIKASVCKRWQLSKMLQLSSLEFFSPSPCFDFCSADVRTKERRLMHPNWMKEPTMSLTGASQTRTM